MGDAIIIHTKNGNQVLGFVVYKDDYYTTKLATAQHRLVLIDKNNYEIDSIDIQSLVDQFRI